MDEQYLQNRKSSCWKRRTRIEKWMFLLCALLLVLLVTGLLITMLRNEKTADICLSPSCVETAAQVLAKVDLAANPCDNFYKFACGNFLKNTILPEDKSSLSAFNIASDIVNERMKTLLASPINKSQDSRPVILAKSTYQACMNISEIEAKSLPILLQYVKNLGGWPTLDGVKWNDANFDWITLNYGFMKLGLASNMFFEFTVDPDDTNSSRRILTLNQLETISPKQFRKGLSEPLVKAYYNYLVKIMVALGADSYRAKRDVREVIDLMVLIAEINVPAEQKRNLTLLQNRRTIKQLEKEFPYVPWLEFINIMVKPATEMKYNDIVVVADLKYFQKLPMILQKPKKTLANFMFLKMFLGLHRCLGEEFAEIKQEFARSSFGRSERRPRWQQCSSRTISDLQIASAQLYVKHFFKEEAKKSAVEMTKYILAVFLEQLESISWMDEITKKEAIAKAKAIKIKVGYPDQLLDDETVDDYYKNLIINESATYLEAYLNISKFYRQLEFSKLNKPIDKDDWATNIGVPYVNAFYDTSDNSISFPASILQGAFFGNERPQYMNYGGIGYVIGHEITHGFDDEGKQYDKNGNLADWWQPKTAKAFAEKAQCIIDQYGNITVPEININLNGINMQGENIADNGAVKHAYLAYKKWVKEHEEEEQLPGLPYSPEQMFWISVGNTWCELQRNEQLRVNVLNQFHAPQYYRVNVPLMNSEYFANDFNCPLGSNMNPERKCVVW